MSASSVEFERSYLIEITNNVARTRDMSYAYMSVCVCVERAKNGAPPEDTKCSSRSRKSAGIQTKSKKLSAGGNLEGNGKRTRFLLDESSNGAS